MAERPAPAPPPEEMPPATIESDEQDYAPPPAPVRPRRGSRDAPPPPIPTERVSVQGQDYDVPPAVAAQMRQWEQQQGRLDALEQAQRQQSTWQQGVERAVMGEPAQQPDEIETLWFSNPSEARRRVVQEAVQQVEQSYRQRESTTQFWSTFDSEHPELASQRSLVQYILATEPAIAQIPNSPEGRAQLASAARERVLGWMQAGRSSGMAPARQTVPPVETGTRRRQASPSRQEPAGPQTMKEYVEMRAERRRQARLRLVGGSG